MKFVLLGFDPLALHLAASIARSDQHELLAAVVPEAHVDAVRSYAPAAALDVAWESLLAVPELDAVLLGDQEDSELRDEQMRKLAQAGIPLLVSHPTCSAIVAYEIDMIRRDVGTVILPIFAGRDHPALTELGRWCRDEGTSPVGAIEKLDLERVLMQPDREQVRRALALDARYLAVLLGGMRQVSAVGTPVDGPALESLTVHLLPQDSNLPVRWSSIPRGPLPAQLRIFGSNGTARLEMPEDAAAWRLVVEGAQPAVSEFTDYDLSSACLHALSQAMHGAPTAADWDDACRDLEIAETAELSLRRRRTLDVFSDPPTEEASFKGFMAAGSCGLLLLILLTFFLLAIVEGFRMPLAEMPAEPAQRWPFWLRLWPVYPLLLFLALQLLLLVAKRK